MDVIRLMTNLIGYGLHRLGDGFDALWDRLFGPEP